MMRYGARVTTRTGGSWLAALLAPANVLALMAGGVASFLTLDPTAFLAALGASGLYAAAVNLSPQVRRFVGRNAEAQTATQAEPLDLVGAALAELSPSQRQHYETLKSVRDDILKRYQQMPGGRVLAASSSSRLDALLTNFARLVGTLNSYRAFLNVAERKVLDEELEQLERELSSDENERLREVKQRRVELLKKRVQRYVQAEESREIVSHQLASIEDVLRLTLEQSIAIRDPQSVGRQLEALTAEVAATEETVREMEQFVQITEEFSSTASLPQGGVRTR